MPTHLTTQTPLLNAVGGGNLGLFVQMNQDPNTGLFTALTTGTDALGDPFATVHELGSHIDTAFNRDANGQYQTPVTLIENDIDHLNMLDNLAPYISNYDNPEDKLEDGTRIGGENSVFGDPTKPFFLFTIFAKPIGGKERARVFMGQFERQGGFDNKGGQRSKFKFTVKSVDGQGLVTVIPTHARTATMVSPTLTGHAAQGIWVSQ